MERHAPLQSVKVGLTAPPVVATVTAMTAKTVAEKMGMKAGQRLFAPNAPRGYEALIGGLPEGVRRVKSGAADFVHLFVKDRAELARELPGTLTAVGEGNTLWVSYPKKTSKVATDISRDAGWEPLAAAGWGIVAIVAVDDTWAALRFMRSGTVSSRAGRAGGQAAPRASPSGGARRIVVPADLLAALEQSPRAKARFEAMPPSHRREHVRVIEEAKRPETRARRVAAAVEKLRA
jgi:hypothetical protein